KTESRYKNKLTAESCFHLHKILDSVEKIKNPDSGNQDFTVFFSSRWCHQQPKIGLYSTISQ
ncbi:hypothetical protein, partial [Phocaeicola vulgatus]|uniref:hypothetical protein n=1 Tax=Phocaeicola vulgatus TaxID=821 RepID=UPI001E61E34C